MQYESSFCPNPKLWNYRSALFIRLERGEVLLTKRADYLLAAYSLSAGSEHILLRHVFPNLSGLMIALATFEL